MSYNAKNYTEQGGGVTHIGGTLIFEEGAQVEGLPSGESTPYTLPAATGEALGGVKQCANQASSTAAELADLVTDFNDLLTKLKTAGVMAEDS